MADIGPPRPPFRPDGAGHARSLLFGLADPAAGALGARARTLRMETLLAVGILAAYGYSGPGFHAGKHYYFDTACAIVALVLAGKFLERGAKERTARAITLLYRMMPRKARLLAGGPREIRGGRRARSPAAFSWSSPASAFPPTASSQEAARTSTNRSSPANRLRVAKRRATP